MNRTNKIFFHWLVELVNSSELDLKADFENLASLENWKLNECCTNGFCILKQWEVWVWKFSNTIEQSISCCCCWREQNGRGWRRATAPRCRPSASSWRTPGRWCPPRLWWIPSPPELVNADGRAKKWRQNWERWCCDGSLGGGLFLLETILTMLDLQDEQMKQSLCQWRPSNEMNLVPPIPETSLSSHAQRASRPK